MGILQSFEFHNHLLKSVVFHQLGIWAYSMNRFVAEIGNFTIKDSPLERLQFRGPPLLSAMLPARFLAQSNESMQ